MARMMIVPALLLAAACLVGCDAQPNAAKNTEPAPKERDREHAHAAKGPHGGSIVELGTRERQAELVRNEQSGEITVYFLDSSAEAASPIDAKEVTINLRHDGRAEQFVLTAAPVEGDPEGTSSRFVGTNKDLAQHLDHDEAHGQLVALIDGKQYRGDIGHHHD